MRAALLALLLAGGEAWGESPQAQAAALSAQARAAERAGQPAEEAAACQALVALGEGGRAQAACEERLQQLAAQADPGGGWAGLAALEAARRQVDPVARRQALEAVAGDPGVAGAVRAQAAVALAGLALAREAPEEALVLLEPWWPGEALPTELRQRVGRARATALQALGRGEEAHAVEVALALPTTGGVASLERQARRAALARGAGFVLGGWALVALPLAWRGWARSPRPRPLGLLPLGVVGLGGLALAGAWEPLVLRPFALLLLALVLTHLVAAGAALALAGRPVARAAMGMLSAAAAVAVGLLAAQAGALWGWLGL